MAIALSVSLVFHSCGSGKGDSTESFNLAELTQDGVKTDSGASTATAVSSDDRFNPFAKRSGTDGAASAQDGDLVNQSIAPPPPPKPKLHVSLTDLGLEVVESLHLTFTKVDVEYTPAGGSVQTVTIFEGERTEDLISLSKGLLKGLGSVTLDPGVVTQVRLITKSAEIKFKDEDVSRPVTVPSGDETGLKLIGNIPLEMGKEIELVIDFDVEKSVHVTGSPTDPKVMLKPTLKVFSLNELHELDNLPEGNHKVLLSAVTDEKDPFSPGIPDWRPSRRPDQDIDFHVDVRETGELKPGPSETTYFTWRVSVASHQRGNTPGLVKEYSDIQCLAGVDCPANTLPSPMKFNVHVDFSGREADTDATTAFADGLYIYVVNTSIVITKAGKEPQGKGNPKGKGKGPIKRDPNMEPGRDEMRVVDRDKFYGSLRLDSRSPEVTNLAPIHRYIFSHPRPKHTLLAVDPIDGEESFSGLNISTWKQILNNKDIISLLPVTVELKEPERFASRGPDRVSQQIRSATLDTTPYGVQEGLNKITGEIEDNAENVGLTLDSSRSVQETQFFVDTQKPVVAWSKPPDGFITNNPIVESVFDFDDPKPSSGMRTSTMFIKYYNNHTGWTLSQGIGDVAFTILEETEPFPGGGKYPRVTTARLTPTLSDGHYTLLGKVADRATFSGNPNDPPVNFSEHTVDFCVDTQAPNPVTIVNVGGVTDGGAVNNLDPVFNVNCSDPFPSCGLKSVTLTAVKTADPAPFPGAGPIPIPGPITCTIPLPTSVCTQGGNFKMSTVAAGNPATADQLRTCYANTHFQEGIYNFTLKVEDKATNQSSHARSQIALDIIQPFFLALSVVDNANDEVKLIQPGDPVVYTNGPRPFKVVADYANGLSGVDLSTVKAKHTCYQSCDLNALGPEIDPGEITLAKAANHAEGVFQPCEGFNNVTFEFKDRAGNPPGGVVSDTRQFCADFNPPIISKVTLTSEQVQTGTGPFGPVYSPGYRIRADVSDSPSGVRRVFLRRPGKTPLSMAHIGGITYERVILASTLNEISELVARDFAGNTSTAPLARPAAAASVTSAGGATLNVPAGAMSAPAFVVLTDVSEGQATDTVGPGVFGASQGQLTYLGGAKIDIGGQTTSSPMKICVPKPPDYSPPSDPFIHVLVFRILEQDANGDGAKDLAIVDNVADTGASLCSASPGFPGIFQGANYLILRLTERTFIITGRTSTDLKLVPKRGSCQTVERIEERQGPFDNWATLGCVDDAAEYLIELVVAAGQFAGQVVGAIVNVASQGAHVNVGTCNPTPNSTPTAGFPPAAEGGPPDQIGGFELEFPAFSIDRGSDSSSAEVEVTLQADMQVPDEAAPATLKTFNFIRTATAEGNGRFVRAGPFPISGYVATVSAENPGSINLAVRSVTSITPQCEGRSLPKTKSVAVQISSPSGAFSDAIGALDGGLGECDRCLALGEKCEPNNLPCFPGSSGCTPANLDKVPCFPKVDQGCRHGISPSDPWQEYYAYVDPLECRPSSLQYRMMQMKRAGVSMVKFDLPWNEIEPEDVTDQSASSGVRFHFDDVGRDYDSYVRMGHKYDMPMMGFFGSGSTPWWISSCCQLGQDEDTCRRFVASLTDCVTYADDPEHPDTQCGFDKDLAQSKALCDLECLRKKTGFGTGQGKGRYLAPGMCAPLSPGGTSSGEHGLYGKFLQLVRVTVQRYRPGGDLATTEGWTSGYGIRDWEFGNELENPTSWGTVRDNKEGVPTFYGAYGEYKDMFWEVTSDIHSRFGPEHRVHGPGPVGARHTASCDFNEDNHLEVWEMAYYCHSKFGQPAISVERLYQVLRDSSVSNYSLNSLAGVVIGFHWYQNEGPSPSGTVDGNRKRAYQFARHLSCMFPGKEIWATEGNWCDPTRAGEGCDLNNSAPSSLAQAGYMVGLTWFTTPDTVFCNLSPFGDINDSIPCPTNSCERIDGLPGFATMGLKRVFWWRSEFPQGAEWFTQGWPPQEFPIFHAIRPAQTTGIRWNENLPFRTGIQRTDLQPRAYFTAKLEASKKYKIKADAANDRLPFSITVLSPWATVFGLSTNGVALTGFLPANTFTPITTAAPHHQFNLQVDTTQTYTFAIVPAKEPPFVPTEGETAGKIGDNNKLSFYEDDGRYKGDPNTGGSPAIVENILSFSEGAYVEGVIRFDLAPIQQQVVARPHARAP